MRKLHLLVGLLILILMPGYAAALPLIDGEIAVGGWLHSPGGYISYMSEDRLDLDEDLSFDDETRVFGRLRIDMPFLIPNIYLMASPMEFKGTSRLIHSFKFGGIKFLPGVDFYSKLTLNQYDVGLYYNVPLIETITLKRVNLEAGLNARILDAEGRVRQAVAGDYLVEASQKETVVLPMIYLAARLRPVERFSIEAEARGISYGGDDVYSLIGRVRVNLIGPLFAAGGYRYDTYNIKKDEFLIDTDFSGPFIEAGFQF